MADKAGNPTNFNKAKRIKKKNEMHSKGYWSNVNKDRKKRIEEM
jgi:hypothetical protein